MTVISTSKPIDIPTFEQIATIVSDLVVDYGNMAQTYYDMFYSQTPMDINLTLFDGDGVLREYTVPNRAKDFRYCRNGKGSPEGVISADVGTIYQDTENGSLYIKKLGNSTTGWQIIDTTEVVEKGYGNPNGRISRSKGTLFTDASSGQLYIKTTSTGVTGWELISANTSALADTSLSNLTAEGEAKFADPDLSNISNLGKSVFANPDLSNLSAVGEKHFVNRGQISNVILEDMGGMQGEPNEYYINIPAGFKVLMPDGRNTDGTLKSIEYITSSAVSAVIPNDWAGRRAVFLKSDGTLSVTCPIERYFIGGSAPHVFSSDHTDAVWYDTRNNYILHTQDMGQTWNTFSATFIGYVSTNTLGAGYDHGYIVSNSPERAMRLVSMSDSDYISSCSTPSNFVYQLTPGQTKSAMIAPMDGIFTFRIWSTNWTEENPSANLPDWIAISCVTTTQDGTLTKLYKTNYNALMADCAISMPIAKGDKFVYNYAIGNSGGYPMSKLINFIANKGEVDSMS